MQTVLGMKPELPGDYKIAEVFLKVAAEQLLEEKDVKSTFALAEVMGKIASEHKDSKIRWHANHELAQAALKTGNEDLSALVLATQFDRSLHDDDPIVRGNASYYVGALAEKNPSLFNDAKNKLTKMSIESTDDRVLHNARAWLKELGK